MKEKVEKEMVGFAGQLKKAERLETGRYEERSMTLIQFIELSVCFLRLMKLLVKIACLVSGNE